MVPQMAGELAAIKYTGNTARHFNNLNTQPARHSTCITHFMHRSFQKMTPSATQTTHRTSAITELHSNMDIHQRVWHGMPWHAMPTCKTCHPVATTQFQGKAPSTRHAKWCRQKKGVSKCSKKPSCYLSIDPAIYYISWKDGLRSNMSDKIRQLIKC